MATEGVHENTVVIFRPKLVDATSVVFWTGTYQLCHEGIEVLRTRLQGLIV